MSSSLERAATAIDRARSVALACHVHPDGDALGSLLGMRLLCEAHGTVGHLQLARPVRRRPPLRVPPRPRAGGAARPVPGRARGHGHLRPRARSPGSAAWPRRPATPATPVELIVVDHHADNERFGTINLVDTRAAATAVVVRDLAAILDWKLTRDIAVCLYTGLVTDTGRFRYPNTTPEVFHLAEELASFDIDIARIEWELFEKHRFAYLRLVGSMLERARLDPEPGSWPRGAPTDDLAEFGVEFDETEGLIDVIRQTAEAERVVRDPRGPR